jgi:alkanesulfonate monooxygenase SsuD/methylene tetrahydromethanopterin reductase-like flavin-dependent oxidoreductase (luciferase family)
VHVDERRESLMYAVFIEVSANESHVEAAREYLPRVAAPRAREAGGKGGYWLAPQNGRGMSVVVFDTEDEARAVAAHFQVGKPIMSDGPVVKTVEVSEVLASV